MVEGNIRTAAWAIDAHGVIRGLWQRNLVSNEPDNPRLGCVCDCNRRRYWNERRSYGNSETQGRKELLEEQVGRSQKRLGRPSSAADVRCQAADCG